MKCILCADVELSKLQRRQTCLGCEQRTRTTLLRVMDAAALLPALFSGLTLSSQDPVSGSHDLPMPGRDAMVILGPGADLAYGHPERDDERPDEQPDDPR